MTKPRDIDLMQLADGELDAAAAARVEASLDDAARAKVGALRDLGTAVRGHLELRADEADARLARMWGEIDKQISPREAAPPEKARAKARPGAWARFTQWLDSHRGHVMTGLVSAGAVAAIMWWLRPGGASTVYVPEGGGGALQPASLKRQAPQVESLDTPEGTSGNVFTIEGEGDEGSTAVILVTPDDVEGT